MTHFHIISQWEFSRASNSAGLGPIWSNFELFPDVMDVSVTCKNEEHPIKNEALQCSQDFPNYNPIGAIRCHRNHIYTNRENNCEQQNVISMKFRIPNSILFFAFRYLKSCCFIVKESKFFNDNVYVITHNEHQNTKYLYYFALLHICIYKIWSYKLCTKYEVVLL